MKNENISGGTTALVVLIIKNKCYIANAGDSRAVLCRDNSPYRLSTDHKADEPQEEKRIIKSGGYVTKQMNKQGKQIGRVNGMLAVSRAFGDFFLEPFVIAEPEIKSFQLSSTQEEFLILACDGLWDVISDEEAFSTVMNNSSLPNSTELAAIALRELALTKESQDNISIVVLKLPKADPTIIGLHIIIFFFK